MKPTDVFIRRPVLAIVANVLILAGGILALRTLSVRQYPKIESSTVTVRTVYVGANAELVRGFITVPLERAIAAADGIDYIESQSTNSLSTINVRLELDFPAASALADITSRVNEVRADLPPEAEIPSIAIERSDAPFAAMYLSFRATSLEPNQLTDYLIRDVQPRLTAVPGVQRAEILGGREFAIRAWLEPEKMAALGVTPSQVRQALAANNVISAVGETKGSLVRISLAASTDLRTADGFEDLVIKNDGDTLVRLADVAEVELGAESYEEDVRFSGEDAVFMGVWVLPGANAIDVIAEVRREMEALQAQLPAGVESAIAFDATQYIEDAIAEVATTLAETVAIVIVVIFLFLGSLRSVLVPVVAIPLSLIGGVFLMQLFGFTFNLLTLLAIVLSVGLVVDDAIVVVENIQRHVGDGQSPIRAALEGARELVGPVAAMTVSLIAVYIPIGIGGGLTGALFREFAFTLAGAVFVSGVVALTLSPVMSSRLIRADTGQGRLGRFVDRNFARLRRGYEGALARTLRVRPAVYLVWALLSLATIPMFLLSPAELAPNEDQNVVFTALEAPANASLEQISGYAAEIQQIFEDDPDYDHSFQLTTASGGFAGMVAVPWSERRRDIFAIQESLSAELARVAGVRAPVFLPPALPSPGRFPVEVVIGSTADHAEIVERARALVEVATESGQFAFPPILDVRIDQAQTEIVLDRDMLGAMGVDMREIGADLSTALSGDFVNRFNLAGRSYKVIPQLERVERLNPGQLESLYVTGPGGQPIRLGAVASLEQTVEPRSLNRFQQLNAVKLSGVATRSLDSGLQVLEDAAAEILPPGYRIDYTGESRQLREEGGKFLPVLGLALFAIFLVLAAQFNSFRDPLVILVGSVPLAMFGALIFTFLDFPGPPSLTFGLTEGWTTTLNIYSQVGLVTLVGLVAKNGILIVEFANVQQRAGLSKLEAIKDAASTRFRPILMTTAATVAGHFPLTLVEGPGAEARNSIGVVLVGGMAIGTVFTLFVVPAVYMLIAREREAPEA